MLAKAGWFNGNPCEIDKSPVDEVINAYHYEIFCRNYEQTAIELNKENK